MDFTALVRSVFNRFSKDPIVRGHSVDELAIVPTSMMLSEFLSEKEDMKKFYDTTRWNDLTSEEKDKSAAKKFIKRNPGAISSGVVRVYSDIATDFTITKDTSFIDSVTGGKFIAKSPDYYSKSSFSGDSGVYYVDIPVVAETPGSVYNAKAGSGFMISNSDVPAKYCKAPFDFSGGVDRESDNSLYERVISSMSDRSIVMKRGIGAIFKERFPSVISHYVVKAGDFGMDRDIVYVSNTDRNIFLGKTKDAFSIKHRAYIDFFPPTIGSRRLGRAEHLASEPIPNSIKPSASQESVYGGKRDWALMGIDMNEFGDDKYKALYFNDSQYAEFEVKEMATLASFNSDRVMLSTGSKAFGIRVDVDTVRLTQDGSVYVMVGANAADRYSGIGICIDRYTDSALGVKYRAAIVHNHKFSNDGMFFGSATDADAILVDNTMSIEEIDLTSEPKSVSLFIEKGVVSAKVSYVSGGDEDLTIPSNVAKAITMNDQSYGENVSLVSDSSGATMSVVNVYDTTKSKPIALFKVKVEDKPFDIGVIASGSSAVNGIEVSGISNYIWNPVGTGADPLASGYWELSQGSIKGDGRYAVKIDGESYVFVTCTTSGASHTSMLHESVGFIPATLSIRDVSIKYSDTASFHTLNMADIYVQTKMNSTQTITESVTVYGSEGRFEITGRLVPNALSIEGIETFVVTREGNKLSTDEKIIIEVEDETLVSIVATIEVYPGIENIQREIDSESVFGNILVRHKQPVDTSIEMTYTGSGSESEIADEIRRYFDNNITNTFSVPKMIEHLTSIGLITSAITSSDTLTIEGFEFFNITKISAVK